MNDVKCIFSVGHDCWMTAREVAPSCDGYKDKKGCPFWRGKK